MYFLHPDKALNEVFAKKPFQGVAPEQARFIFIGLDANYSADVDENAVYPRLLEYLSDGEAFWKRFGVHHPFLLPEYRKGDGWKYHATFSKIGFTSQNAHEVSFVELIDKPTYGRSALSVEDLNPNHLKRVNEAILNGAAKHIFIPTGVARLMTTSPLFSWLPKTPIDSGPPLKIWARMNGKTVYWHYHFSVYGAFEQQKQKQLAAISQLI